jgi:hypothetical protein
MRCSPHSPWLTADEGGVRRVSGLSYQDFVHEHLLKATPVIVSDGAACWRALERWSPEFFRAEFGERPVPTDVGTMRVVDLVDRVVGATERNPAPYLKGTGNGQFLGDIFPELLQDVTPEPVYLRPNWLSARFFPHSLRRRLNNGPRQEIYFGGFGAGFGRLHWDDLRLHVFTFQVYGTKWWLTFPPEESRNLYPDARFHNVSAVSDLANPDVERFPAITKARGRRWLLRAGDMLYLPPGWWHTTWIDEPSISISINSANASNWWQMARDLRRRRSLSRGLLETAALAAYWALHAPFGYR